MLLFILLLVHGISSRLSKNSEAFASEFPENLEEMFPPCYLYNFVCNMSRYLTILLCFAYHGRVHCTRFKDYIYHFYNVYLGFIQYSVRLR